MPLVILFSLIFAAIVWWLARKYLHRAHRDRLLKTPLPSSWLSILEQNISIYTKLPPPLREELHGYIHIFLDEKEFIGRDGVAITDEIRVTVAGNACLLLLQGQKRHFPGFTSILIYPDTYVAHQTSHDGLVATEAPSRRAGESWVRGPVVLSWADVARGSLNERDGHNVVIHEFAHKLDEQSGDMNGLPVLRDNSHYEEWTEVLSEEFDALKDRAQRGTNKVMDAYGTVSPPEFFAVATESFFEKPVQMKKRIPDLYAQLKTFYNVDPAAWHDH